MPLDDLVPDTPAAASALQVAQQFHSPALLNHCRRSHLWAAAYGRERGIAFDAELLYVAAMLHDIGLVPVFDSAAVPFEEAGGAVAWVFGAGAGWDADRRRRTAGVIVAHMAPEVDVAADPEGHLLELATGLDVSGRRPDDWPADLRAEVLEAFPRLGLAEEFLGCFTEQARRKPSSLAGQFVAGGFADRVRANPLDRSGVTGR
ncbi:HD domain-containing protein [Modestobacter sp. VKM Ac-2983]|uniref:HD domain-containing protein n=1 Tax=Modestobacter sp. VKM Ac-2983 TaxID=3004137 RepID=UPI0022ABB69B|nr:HD domain-containing protein [Modestobacter sp. VKM Ac-2983]MCZ2804947.1 HD domain-containing protein [Modestobacter sp. VKM Ac-2983]